MEPTSSLGEELHPLKSSVFHGGAVTSIDTHKPREGAYNFFEMFERYTEKARRAIFFARYEASQFGSLYIETEHLLLGLLREDNALTNRFLRSDASGESIRKQIEDHTTVHEKVSTSIDLPLSNECKRVLAYAAEEAERLSQEDIRTEHLLLGLLREEKCFAATILRESGVTLLAVREELPPGDQEVGQPQRRWAAAAWRRYRVMIAAQFAALILFAVVLARSAVTGIHLLAIGAIWLGVALAWNVLTPSSFFWSFGKRNRTLAKSIIYSLFWVFQLFMFGWLVPLGVGIYRVVVSRN